MTTDNSKQPAEEPLWQPQWKKPVVNAVKKPSWDDDGIYSYLKTSKPPEPLWYPQWKKPVVRFVRSPIWDDESDIVFSPSYSYLLGNTFYCDDYYK